MISIIFANQLAMISLGLFFCTTGIIGSSIQIYLFGTVRHYRKTPCTFYFIVAAVHELCLFISAMSPMMVAGFMNVDLTRISAAWCKLRFFFGISCCIISSTCACLAAIDQFLVTSQRVRLRQWSNIKNAYRASQAVVIIWWIHSIPWLYYQDLSPTTGVCYYRSQQFRTYAIFFLCFLMCGTPIFFMIGFGILTYRNIQITNFPLRLRFDRQMTIVVFSQILLNIIGLGPYCVYCVYISITLYVEKDAERILKESLAANITYLFCSVAYGGRFYLYLLVSARFRSLVTKKLFCWKQTLRIHPIRT